MTFSSNLCMIKPGFEVLCNMHDIRLRIMALIHKYTNIYIFGFKEKIIKNMVINQEINIYN